MIISELPSSVAVLPIVADSGLANASTCDWPSPPPTKFNTVPMTFFDVVIGDWPDQNPPSGTKFNTVPPTFLDVAIGDWPGQNPPAK